GGGGLHNLVLRLRDEDRRRCPAVADPVPGRDAAPLLLPCALATHLEERFVTLAILRAALGRRLGVDPVVPRDPILHFGDAEGLPVLLRGRGRARSLPWVVDAVLG